MLRALNIGAGDHPLPSTETVDWLNGDTAYPHARGGPNLVYLDVRWPFPFNPEHFDRIYSEHMIEHVPFPAGKFMLSECYRALKPGGRIRIATPHWNFLWGLFSGGPGTSAYIEWASAAFNPDHPVCPETVINNFVRAWGHKFIWSGRLMMAALTDIGFQRIQHFDVGQSGDPAFRGIENAARMPEGFLALESMIVEAEKP